jgi:hypothetical protein
MFQDPFETDCLDRIVRADIDRAIDDFSENQDEFDNRSTELFSRT